MVYIIFWSYSLCILLCSTCLKSSQTMTLLNLCFCWTNLLQNKGYFTYHAKTRKISRGMNNWAQGVKLSYKSSHREENIIFLDQGRAVPICSSYGLVSNIVIQHRYLNKQMCACPLYVEIHVLQQHIYSRPESFWKFLSKFISHLATNSMPWILYFRIFCIQHIWKSRTDELSIPCNLWITAHTIILINVILHAKNSATCENKQQCFDTTRQPIKEIILMGSMTSVNVVCNTARCSRSIHLNDKPKFGR